jgi:hypothetical protein
MPQIQKTMDYSIFNKMEGNRHLDRFHLKKLTAAIKEDNQLEVHPIIVNKDFCVIDGQHRLEAAKALGYEIFFIQSDNVTDLHVIHGNVNQKSFEVDNYIDYFAIKEKNPVYIQLKEMLKSTGLKPKALLTLILGTISPSILDFLKTGKFQFPRGDTQHKILDLYFDFMAYVKDKRIKPISIFTNHKFTRALRWLYNTNGFDSVTFFKKLDLRWFDLKPQTDAQAWYNLLICIYNFKNHNRIEINEDI